jgi:hypothetical protein
MSAYAHHADRVPNRYQGYRRSVKARSHQGRVTIQYQRVVRPPSTPPPHLAEPGVLERGLVQREPGLGQIAPAAREAALALCHERAHPRLRRDGRPPRAPVLDAARSERRRLGARPRGLEHLLVLRRTPAIRSGLRA